jgi:hypothetical protein
MGGQVVMASKGGTNQFHGGLFDYVRNAAFDARNYFDYGYRAANGRRIPNFVKNQFGATLGGPIRKDKTFFFATYESLRSATGASVVDTVPLATCLGAAGQAVWNGQGTQPGIPYEKRRTPQHVAPSITEVTDWSKREHRRESLD